MKRKVILGGIFGLLLLVAFGWNSLADGKQQKADVDLRQPHQVGNVLLEAGKYLIVHEEHVAGQEGQACTFFYHPPRQMEKNAVARFHCRGTEGEPASKFTMRTFRQPDGKVLLRSIQFAGSSEIHALEPAS